MRHHGRNGKIEVDVSALAAGTTLTELPFIADWSVDGTTAKVDVTCMGDGNTVELAGFKSFKGTIAGFDDAESDVYRIIGDGVPRIFRITDDVDATTKKFWHGTATFDASTSGGSSKAVAVSINLSAASTIVETHAASAPTFP